LEAALVGYQAQLASIQQSIKEIRKQLGQKAASASTNEDAAPRTRRRLSAAARKRIALAQKKRWAEYNRKKNSGQ